MNPARAADTAPRPPATIAPAVVLALYATATNVPSRPNPRNIASWALQNDMLACRVAVL
ncbi:hypothetical protein ABT404_24430 [Streptomyces hyaluromycini]|uniref:Uncharacterized protein n=1 Tax=Streptomyces hyaluromycini TaxID=1377993 RepID=A0ABV1X0P2_9ACTN